MAKKAAAHGRGRISVTLAALSEDVREIRVARGSTLKSALLAAGYEESALGGLLDGLRVNGREVELNARLAAGAFITLSPNVEGGSR